MKTFFMTLAVMFASASMSVVSAQSLPEKATDIAPMVVGEIVPDVTLTSAEIEKMGYQVICVCPDAAAGLMKTSEESTMPLKHFYGDPKGNLAKAMGIAFLATGRAVEFTKKSSENLNTDPYLPAPAFYVIDTNNEVKFAGVRPNAIPAAKRIGWNFYGPILKSLKLYYL